MIILWLVAIAVFASFGLIVFIGAPYVPTRQKEIKAVFKFLTIKPGSLVVDLGSGDGRVLQIAAKQGLRAVGYELNPFLWLVSKIRLRQYSKSTVVHFTNLWSADLSQANMVFIFTAQPYVKKLHKKFLTELKPGSYVASNAFDLPGHKPIKQIGTILIYRF